MNVLIVNPIIYTSETKCIKKVNTIKDTMIYDLCLAFKQLGHNVVLAACEDYKPITQEEYPFDIIWLKARLKKVFQPHNIPFCPQIIKYVKNNNFDLIITSEVFSLNSLMLTFTSNRKLIVWQELGKHNRLMHKLPSKIWYNIIARLFFKNTKIVVRSINARDFIQKYCNNVSDIIIDHGVNLDKFSYETNKENIFAVSSQLIDRKRIDKIIIEFSKYIKNIDNKAKLYIMGDGDKKQELIDLSRRLKIENNVVFTGKLPHNELVEILKKAKAMLVYTMSDLNMVSIVESIAVATPVITTSVPYSCSYIKQYNLGIVDDNWNENALKEIAQNNIYVENCLKYRHTLDTKYRVKQFIEAL